MNHSPSLAQNSTLLQRDLNTANRIVQYIQQRIEQPGKIFRRR